MRKVRNRDIVRFSWCDPPRCGQSGGLGICLSPFIQDHCNEWRGEEEGGLLAALLPPQSPQHSELEVGTPELRPCSLSALGSCVVRGNAIDFELVSKFRFQKDIE